MTNYLWFLFGIRPLTFVDGGEISVHINEFHFASTVANFIGLGLNFGLVDFFKAIQRPKSHWIWTKPHDIPGNMSYRKTTLVFTWITMNTCHDLVYFILCLRYLALGVVVGVFEVTLETIM